MSFKPSAYGPEIAEVLSLAGNGARLLPLTCGPCVSDEAGRRLKSIDPLTAFAGARAPQAALSGLWLYFGCFEESHAVAQEIESAEGSFWHGILHRQEPDAANAAYWFRRVGAHAIYADLQKAAQDILAAHPQASLRLGSHWDPFAFIDFCEKARSQPGSDAELVAMEIQREEWQRLFDYCARPRA